MFQENEENIDNSSCEDMPSSELSSAIITTGKQDLATKLGKFSFNADEKSENGIVERSYNVAYEENIKDISFDASITKSSGKISHSEKINYNLDTDNFKVNANLSNSDNQLASDVGVQTEFDNGVTASADFHKDNSDTSLTVGVKKLLINPNNVANINNQDKERKEELVETGDRFNLQTKVGVTKDSGFYTNNSLMYRIDNDNFIKTDLNQNGNNSREIVATADLKHIKTEYSNVKNEDIEVKTIINKLDTTFKGKNNQYNANITHAETVIKNPENQNITKNLKVETGAVLNRNEYGEFNSGLNGEIKTAISLENGKFDGYNVGLDGAYNYYGCENNSTTDYLLRTHIDFGKAKDNKTFSAELSGAYRINNCNTIFESGLKYSTNYSKENKSKQVAANVGIFQNVGKNFGDAVVYTQVGVGKNKENSVAHPYVNWNVGSKVKLSKKLTLNSNINYGSGGNFGGEIGGNFSF